MSGSKRRILPPYRENVNEFLKDTNLLAIAKDLFSVGLVDGKVYKIAGLDYKTILAKKEEIVGGVLASVDDLGKLRQFVEVLERHRSSEHDVEFIEKMKRKCKSNFFCAQDFVLIKLVSDLYNVMFCYKS